jgi:photosystem II stability/assembly factor-like uncharacterized protein
MKQTPLRPVPVRVPGLFPLWILSLIFALSLAVAAAGGSPAYAAKAHRADRAAPAAAGAADPGLLAGMSARSIGPAAMSGRVVALAGVPGNPATIYVGSASGGLWRSKDGGLTWTPLFDDEPVASIGAVAVDPTAPDVIWVGTGEANPRNSASVGDGVYKSMDGGEHWSHLGLEKTEKIGRVLLDPRRPNVAYVCALGSSWAETGERGVYKTTDGGKTWVKVLYVDRTTGCADLAMDPDNPNKLFAAMWQHRRWPWFFESGGPGSGLYVSFDGGTSWTKKTPEDGLPEGDLGRIGVAKDNAFYASSDGGDTFHKLTSDPEAGDRPFYFSRLRVDPVDPNRIYSLYSRITLSEDAGKTWRSLAGFGTSHPDHHAMWIDPDDPDFVVEGNDGGVFISRDRGESWRFVADLPLAQYYHVRVDDAVPYNVYGGLQDNGSWKGPSETWERGGIRNYQWAEVGFGDGFDTAPDPKDPMRGYSMSQEGYLLRWDLRTGERKDVRPAPPEGVDELRFNWNAGFAPDPFDPATIYFGSQFLHESNDRGETWRVISPDLTTDNPEWQKQDESGGLTPDVSGAENFTTIIAIAPSPVERGVIWVGTDDGRVQVTRDGGGSWASVEDNVPGVPKNTWVPRIEASPHDAATAFVVFDNHRRFDWMPYVVVTHDYGASWQSLATKDLRGYALSVVQDPVDPKLLFLGTEFGLWVSLDGGGSWMRWTAGIPTVAVRDMRVQRRESDLVIGTHGRGVFILDDVAPLREMGEEGMARVLAEPLHLFPIPDAQQHEVAQGASSRFPGSGEFRGENPPYGAMITFSLHQKGLPYPDKDVQKERQKAERQQARKVAGTSQKGTTRKVAGTSRKVAGTSETEAMEAGQAPVRGAEAEAAGGRPRGGRSGGEPKAKVEVRDASGKVIRTFEAPVTLGVNRIAWDLRRDPFRRPPNEGQGSFFRRGGVEVLPGTYSVKVSYGDSEASQPVRVLADPRIDVPPEAREANQTALLAAGALQERLSEAIERIHDLQGDLGRVQDKVRAARKAAHDDELDQKVMEAARDLGKGLSDLEAELWVPEGSEGIPPETTPWDKVSNVLRSIRSSWDAPNAAQQEYLARATTAVDKGTAEADRFFAEKVPAFKEAVDEAGLGLLAAPREGGASGAQ